MRPRSRSTCEDALRDERQREARVELEDVVRHPGRHVLHGAEPTASLLLHFDADELEDVVAALFDGRKLVPRDVEHDAALDGAVEPDDHPAAGPLRGDNRCSLLARQQARAHREALGVVARVLDDEGAVEAVRAADTADRNEVGRSVQDVARRRSVMAGACQGHRERAYRTYARDRGRGRAPRDSGFILSGALLFVDDLEQDALVLVRAARADDRPERADDAALPADHLADVLLGHAQLEHDRAVALGARDRTSSGLSTRPLAR